MRNATIIAHAVRGQLLRNGRITEPWLEAYQEHRTEPDVVVVQVAQGSAVTDAVLSITLTELAAYARAYHATVAIRDLAATHQSVLRNCGFTPISFSGRTWAYATHPNQ
jgi:hypothetical protein